MILSLLLIPAIITNNLLTKIIPLGNKMKQNSQLHTTAAKKSLLTLPP